MENDQISYLYYQINVVHTLLGAKKIAVFEPEKYTKRLVATPIMSREKHFYEYSNQFVMGDGIIIGAKP